MTQSHSTLPFPIWTKGFPKKSLPNCYNFRRSRSLSLFRWHSAVDVTGLLAIAAPPLIFHLFCLVFPHTWFTFPHQTKCILPPVSPMSVWNCSLCRVLRFRLACARCVSNLGLFVLFNPVHFTVVVLCAASPVPLGQGIY